MDGGNKKKIVLVTGGAGAIGGNLVLRLNDLNTDKIVILDNFSSSCGWNVPAGPKIQFIRGDDAFQASPTATGTPFNVAFYDMKCLS